MKATLLFLGAAVLLGLGCGLEAVDEGQLDAELRGGKKQKADAGEQDAGPAARDAGSSTGTDAGSAADAGGPGSDAGTAARWRPAPGTSWQIQLSGTANISLDVAVYDLDLFETPRATIDALHAAGNKVICYFSTAYENWRPDAARFTAAVLGNPMDGWPGERWVDIRSSVVRDIARSRMDLAVQKRCDAIDPDNVDVSENDPGFPLTLLRQGGA